jgi:CheY-like chemotaxis protein
LLTGRKLLLADDSVAIQKVIDLTFTDEGMEVTTVGDGDQARERLEEMDPDIVLADCFMPGTDGYELCRIIRQTERLKQIPVMLLVGSFEPFDEAEARQAGASDVVTKPFQSIRDLVSRVGSLLGKQPEDAGAANQYSTLGLERTDEQSSTASADAQTTDPDFKVFVEAPAMDSESMSEANVNVMVEAAAMPEHESAESAATACAADVELQTADTRKLERVDDEDIAATTEPSLYAEDDTIEIEPVMDVERNMDASMDVSAVNERPSWDDVEAQAAASPATPTESAEMFSDVLLDLGQYDNASARAVDEEVFLDLDFEAPLPVTETWPESVVGSLSTAAAGVADGSSSKVVPSGVGVTEVAPAAEPVEGDLRAKPQTEIPQWGAAPPAFEDAAPAGSSEAAAATPAAQTASPGDLSPETIDAIARRVVEQMSDKVVREIAWEVLPDLAELLIKQKLHEQK